MGEKYKRDGLFKQQILFVIPEIHNEISAIHIAGYTLQMNIWGKIGSSYQNLPIIPQTKNPTNVGF